MTTDTCTQRHVRSGVLFLIAMVGLVVGGLAFGQPNASADTAEPEQADTLSQFAGPVPDLAELTLARLDEVEALWAAADITSYHLSHMPRCETCDDWPTTNKVVDGQVVDVIGSLNGPQPPASVLTVDAMFVELRAWLDDGQVVYAEFDLDLGLPVSYSSTWAGPYGRPDNAPAFDGGPDRVIYGFLAGSGPLPTCDGQTATLIGHTIWSGLDGSPYDDVMVGGPETDGSYGGAGDDIICGHPTRFKNNLRGGPGRDRLFGGNGDDTLVGGDGIDYMWGGDGDDLLWGFGGSDRMRGGAGNDFLRGGSGADRMWGQGGEDLMRGDGGKDQMWGGADDDTMQGNWESDVLRGGGGNDTIGGAAGKDALYGGDGDDVLTAGVNTDYLEGNAGTDSLSGAAGADVLSGGPGADRLDGGGHSDTCYRDAADTLISCQIRENE